jgi:hypothetical protein
MSVVVRKFAPILIFAIPGLFVVQSYYTGWASDISTTLISWPVTLAAFSVALGGATMLRYHLVAVARKGKGWEYSLLTLGSFFVVYFSAFAWKSIYDWVISNVTITLQVAFSGFFGFYNYTLFFRAARVRTWEVGLLVVSSILVMLWMAPIGEVLWVGFPIIGKWINDVPNGGTMRGILICVAIGMVGLFVRSCLGYEKASFGGE